MLYVYIDFNEEIARGLFLLSDKDSKVLHDGQVLKLEEGMVLCGFMEDLDENGDESYLIAEGRAEINGEEYDWAKKARWLLRVNVDTFRHTKALGL